MEDVPPTMLNFSITLMGTAWKELTSLGFRPHQPIERGGALGREARRVTSGQKGGEQPLGHPATSNAPSSQEGIEKREWLSFLSDESSGK